MLHQIISDASYMAHGYCLLWKPWLVTLHAASDIVIALSYFAIPVAIWIFLRKRPTLQMRGLAGMFAAFILLCGLTHVLGLVTLWFPIYEAQGVVKAATAAVSLATAIIVFPLIPKALAIPDPDDLKLANARLVDEVAAHKATLKELEQARAMLEETVTVRTKALRTTEKLFRAVQESSPDGFMLFNSIRDDEGKIVDFEWMFSNEASDKVVGREPGGLIGKRLLVELPGHKQEGLFDTYCDVVETGMPWQGEFLYDHDGIGSWFRTTAVKAEDGFAVSFTDITGRKRNEQQLQLLMSEVNHRSKNLLSVIQAIVRLTSRDTEPEKFSKALIDRLYGLAASQDLIVNGNWTTVDLEELIRSQLSHLGKTVDDRIRIEGESISVTPQAAQGLGLAIHELATNAIKHGALSNETGTISIEWSVTNNDGTGTFRIVWAEHGGPDVGTPERTGFGRTVIENMAAQAVRGDVEITFESAGMRWQLTAPEAHLVNKL
jgi:two-component sensor histidine kinase